jgi:hypothetical protein
MIAPVAKPCRKVSIRDGREAADQGDDADDRAQDLASPAVEAGAPDLGRRDHLELKAVGGVGMAGAGAGRQQLAHERGAEVHDDDASNAPRLWPSRSRGTGRSRGKNAGVQGCGQAVRPARSPLDSLVRRA